MCVYIFKGGEIQFSFVKRPKAKFTASVVQGRKHSAWLATWAKCSFHYTLPMNNNLEPHFCEYTNGRRSVQLNQASRMYIRSTVAPSAWANV